MNCTPTCSSEYIRGRAGGKQCSNRYLSYCFNTGVAYVRTISLHCRGVVHVVSALGTRAALYTALARRIKTICARMLNEIGPDIPGQSDCAVLLHNTRLYVRTMMPSPYFLRRLLHPMRNQKLVDSPRRNQNNMMKEEGEKKKTIDRQNR